MKGVIASGVPSAPTPPLQTLLSKHSTFSEAVKPPDEPQPVSTTQNIVKNIRGGEHGGRKTGFPRPVLDDMYRLSEFYPRRVPFGKENCGLFQRNFEEFED